MNCYISIEAKHSVHTNRESSRLTSSPFVVPIVYDLSSTMPSTPPCRMSSDAYAQRQMLQDDMYINDEER